MKESTLEKKVGDILERKRLARDALDGQEVAYGPLTLQPVEDGILPVDFDGRVYETITTEGLDEIEEQVNHVVTQADDAIEQLYDEL